MLVINFVKPAAAPSGDHRDDMPWDTVHWDANLNSCTYCRDRSVLHHCYVTKEHWANRPLGQLVSRCPDHQAKRDEVLRVR